MYENVGYRKDIFKSAVILYQKSVSGWYKFYFYPYRSFHQLEIFGNQSQSFEINMAKRILPILGTLMLLSSTTFAAVDCNSTDSEAFFDASCWASLNLTNWLSTWQAPSVCEDTGSGRNCCLENEAWSTCFLRLGTGNSGYNCSQISVNTNVCAYSGALASDLDPSIQAQVRYVLRTIFSM